jgi:hypothetical protein
LPLYKKWVSLEGKKMGIFKERLPEDVRLLLNVTMRSAGVELYDVE